jgi:DNA-directed RNA polymerase subunit RPC12/RpoP
MSVAEIPSYRELTHSASQENTVRPLQAEETMMPTSDTPVDETDSEYGSDIPPPSRQITPEAIISPPKQNQNTWRCNRCGDEVKNHYDVCQTCGGRRGEPGREEISAEAADWEDPFEAEFDLNCPKCGEKMLAGYLFTESDDALIFNYQEENDIIIGRGTQMGFVCLNCNLISFPFREDSKQD